MYYDDHGYGYEEPFAEEDFPTMEELEREGFRSEWLELVLLESSLPEGLSLELCQRKEQIAHYLSGGGWDDYKENPDYVALRKILGDPSPGFLSEILE